MPADLGISSKKQRILARVEHELENGDFLDRLEPMFVHDEPSAAQEKQNLGLMVLHVIYASMGKEGILEFADWATHESMGFYPQQAKPLLPEFQSIVDDFAEANTRKLRQKAEEGGRQAQASDSPAQETRRDFNVSAPLKLGAAMAAVSGAWSAGASVTKPVHEALPMVRKSLSPAEKVSDVASTTLTGGITGYYIGKVVEIAGVPNNRKSSGRSTDLISLRAGNVGKAPMRRYEAGLGERSADDIARYAAEALETFLDRDKETSRPR